MQLSSLLSMELIQFEEMKVPELKIKERVSRARLLAPYKLFIVIM